MLEKVSQENASKVHLCKIHFNFLSNSFSKDKGPKTLIRNLTTEIPLPDDCSVDMTEGDSDGD